MPDLNPFDVLVVGGGPAGLSAAIYLARARRNVVVIDSGESMARWEPRVENYFGFPEPVAGTDLLNRGRRQALRFGARIERDEIQEAEREEAGFILRGRTRSYRCRKLLLATGIFHIPPDINGVAACLGKSLFFCKDCDGLRVQGKRVGVYGWNNEAVEYALALLFYSPCVQLFTDGHKPAWSRRHSRWMAEYEIPLFEDRIRRVLHQDGQIQQVQFESDRSIALEALFTTRGDIYFNELARGLGARTNPCGDIEVNAELETSIHGLFAAGCVTPANCQIIISAGHGALAGQSINRQLFEESLKTHALRRFREEQLQREETQPQEVQTEGV